MSLKEPLLKDQKKVAVASNFASNVVSGALYGMILTFSFVSTAISSKSYKSTRHDGVEVSRIIKIGIPVLLAAAFSLALKEYLAETIEIDAEKVRERIKQRLPEGEVEPTETGKSIWSGILFFLSFILFCIMLVLPFIIYYNYYKMESHTLLIWFFIIAVAEIIVVSLISSLFTYKPLIPVMLQALLIGIVATGLPFLVGLIIQYY